MITVESYLSYLQSSEEEVSEIAVASAAITAVHLAMLAGDVYRKHLSKIARACRNFEGMEKTKCTLGLKIKGLGDLIRQLRTAQGKCEDAKCTEKMRLRIEKQNMKMRTLQSQLRTVIRQSYGR